MGKAARTKETILDAAEACFAEHGYDTVSMRDVADGASVPLGLINYHFGTKEKLFEAVIARRAEELNARRREALAAVGKGAPATIEAVLGAFLHPYLELTLYGGLGWRSYGKLIAETGQSNRWCRLITKQFGGVAKLFIDALIRSDPGLTRELATRGYVHMVSIMVGIFAANDLLDIISGGRTKSRDLKRACDTVIPFLAGAFHAWSTDAGRAPRAPVRTRRIARRASL
jgi:AcrR family transcriptional regulator